MSFWILYLLAFLPVIVGAVFYFVNPKQFTWMEWAGNSVLAFIIAGIFHACAIGGATSDTETWSGQVTSVKFIPQWVESYRIQHTVEHSSGSGKNRRTWTTTYYTHHTDTHQEERWIYTNLPNLSIETDRATFEKYKAILGATVKTENGCRSTFRDSSKMKSGDPLDYITSNTTKAIIPVTNEYSFSNRVKAASTLFSFAKLPDAINSKLPDYPENSDHFKSSRLLGSACLIDINAFDQMNTRLGFSKKVNVVIVGLNSETEIHGKWLEAKWIGGKKNDVVIVFGGPNKKPDWVYAFGWTDHKTALRSLEDVVLNNGVSNETLPKIEETIVQYYKIKNWHDFDYISIPISSGWLIGYIIFMVISQTVLIIWYHKNDITDSPYSRFVPSRFR